MPEEITPAQILEALNDKADRDLMNVAVGADVVVEYQMPNANNNYTWYRKYASGWVEQGGMSTPGQVSPVTVQLPIEMDSGKYQVQLTANITNSAYDYTTSRIATVRFSSDAYIHDSTTSFSYCVTGVSGTSSVPVTWEVKGMAAIQ